MSELTTEHIGILAEAAGLELDEPRARTISSRLSAIMEELDEIPDDQLTSIEPAHRFNAEAS